MPRTTTIPGLLLLLSGCCALVYQVTWLRQLRLVFGASTAANAAVLAIFMGGLGLGGLLLGRRADTHPHPLALYGRLELAVALSAAASPWLVDGVRLVYAGLGGTPVLGTGPGTVVRLLLSAAVLGLPTFLMGGTLPAVVRAVCGAEDVGRRSLGQLYAMNTLGSVGGAMLATFITIEAVGIRTSLWGAVGVNLAVAVTAMLLGRRSVVSPAAPALPASTTASSAPTGLVLVSAGLTGFAFLLMELVWYRMLAPLLGGSSYSFGMILAVALLGIGLGGLAYGAFARRGRPTLLLFAGTAALEAALVALPLALGDDFALWVAGLRPLGEAGFSALVGVWGIIAAAAILPAAIVSGFQFPLLVGLLGRGGQSVGRQVGLAYACNTLGSIVGSLAGGFGLIPLLGAVGAWRLVVVLLSGLAAVAMFSGADRRRTPMLAVVLGVVLGLSLASRPGPTAAWRHNAIGAGRFTPDPDPTVRADDLQAIRRSVMWETDGIESSIALASTTGNAFVIHGKVDGHVIGDAPTNLWLGLLPTLLHPDPARVLVIGLGTGQTAGWAASDAAEVIDVIELEPAIADVAAACADSNRDALRRPELAVHYGDAREWLMSTPERYDVIISEPSNPYRAGIASLFSTEFYAAADQRLDDDGLFLQWIQGYELSGETLAVALATLRTVFPHVEIWEGASDGDLLLVASQAPVAHDAARLSARLAQSPWREGLVYGWRVEGLAGLYAAYVGNTALVDALSDGAPINTDDHPVIEFGFAKHVGASGGVSVENIRATAHSGRWDSPPNSALPDIRTRTEARHSKAIAGRSPPGVPAGVSGPLADRMAARVAWSEGDLTGAIAAWDRQTAPAQGPLDHLILGEGRAALGDDRALEHAAALRELLPTEASLIAAHLAASSGAGTAAVAHLQAALVHAASDPWVHPEALRRGLALAAALSQQLGPEAAAMLIEPVLEPFSVGNLDEERRATALRLATIAGFDDYCARAFATLEPHVPLHPGLLNSRVRCYELTEHPLLPRARAEQSRHLSQ